MTSAAKPPSPADIRLERVTKIFAGTRAVDGVDLMIEAGCFFSLLGPSGCGKTTLLRMLAGLESPTAGRIAIGGVDVTLTPPERRPTNMVFQSYALFPHLDVRGNVGFGLRKERLSRALLRQRVDDALAMVRLDGLHARYPHELSGGQRQRVALARALVKRPQVLLLDEPLAALDKRLREAMQQELRRLQTGLGITFVFVTHDQDEAFAMSDRIAVMEHGRILQVASPSALYQQPNCLAVAEFVGDVNLIQGRIERCNATQVWFVADALGSFEITAPAGHWVPGARATLAVRPEQLALTSGVDAAAATSLGGAIVEKTYLGDRTYLSIAVQGVATPLRACVTGGQWQQREFDVGKTVWVDFSPEAALVP